MPTHKISTVHHDTTINVENTEDGTPRELNDLMLGEGFPVNLAPVHVPS